jgi:Ser/Thr protein kinase RdoA (MazF antagonist)
MRESPQRTAAVTAQSVFDAAKPALSDADITTLLHTNWGLSGSVQPLVSERDQNVQLDTGTARYVLKIANRAEDTGFLALQNAALAHIAVTDPGLGVPRVVLTLAGADMAQFAGQTVRLMTFLPGTLYSAVTPNPALLSSLGDLLGRLSAALRGFGHPAAHRPGFLWNLDELGQLCPWLDDIAPAHRDMVRRVFDRYDARVVPYLKHLRGAVVHQDANDNNLLVDDAGGVSGIIDFGDMSFGRQINELAVALAYALLDCDNIYASAAPLIAAYAARFPLESHEAEVLFDLVAARLAASVCISSHRAKDHPDNTYLTISQAPAFRLLDRLDQTNPAFLAAFARTSAGLDAVPTHDAVVAWLRQCQPKGLFDIDLNRAGRFVLSLAKDAPGMIFAGDPVGHWNWLEAEFARQGASYAIGLYGEDRDVYKGPQFRSAASPEARSQHLGVDIFIGAGTRLYAPLAGRVLSVVDNDLPYDYGPTVILEHQAGEGGPLFWTLYGHLSRETLVTVTVGP